MPSFAYIIPILASPSSAAVVGVWMLFEIGRHVGNPLSKVAGVRRVSPSVSSTRILGDPRMCAAFTHATRTPGQGSSALSFPRAEAVEVTGPAHGARSRNIQKHEPF